MSGVGGGSRSGPSTSVPPEAEGAPSLVAERIAESHEATKQ